MNKKEETSRRFSTTQHPFYWGIDLHARSMYVCIVNHAGEVLLHRHRKAAPEPLLTAIAPSRQGLVVAVECMFTWYGLADFWAPEGIAFVLGHALSRKAMHGGTAKNETIDAHKIAVLLRGGLLPHASGYPAPRRATRALFRRRTHLRRNRAALLAHVHHTTSQYNLPEIGKQRAYTANRAGVADRFADPAGHKTIAVDLALITYSDEVRKDLALAILKAAKPHEAQTLSLLQTGPGVGKMLRLVLLYDIHAIDRCASGQEFVASCRLVTGAKASAGKRVGTSGKKIGPVHLTGALSEAATLCLRNHAAGQSALARFEKTHGQGKAWTILAHKLARTVYSMRKRQTALDMATCLPGEGSSAGAPDVSLDPLGMRLSHASALSSVTASLNATGRLGRVSPSPRR